MAEQDFYLTTLLVCLYVFSASSADLHLECSVPSKFWCSSKELQRRCQVSSQCRQWSFADVKPVALKLFIESLCPDTMRFFRNQMEPVYEQLAGTGVMTVHFVPYGKASEQWNGVQWIFTCQHGSEECRGNLVQTCAMFLIGNAHIRNQFIICLMTSEYPPDSGQQCADSLGIDYSKIDFCVKSSLGNLLEHRMAVETERADPPVTWIPWIVINGEHSDEIQQQGEHDLLNLICDTYTGKKPEACNSITLMKAPSVDYFDSNYCAWSSPNTECNLPPNLWCSSVRIAEKCQVSEQCMSLRSMFVAPPVNFSLYYETLCPGCEIMIQQQVFPTWQKVGDIMNITLVPYGNAHEHWDGEKWIFDCQHGADECTGNIIQSCAIHLLAHPNQWMPYINCMESSSKLPETAGKECADKLGYEWQPIYNCTSGSEGNYLEHQMALLTDALDPPHQYTPWVTLNGVHTEEIQAEAQEDLLKLICDTYTGTKPEACTK